MLAITITAGLALLGRLICLCFQIPQDTRDAAAAKTRRAETRQ